MNENDKAVGLLPCPFCGAPATYEQVDNDGHIGDLRWSAGCNTDGCIGQQSIITYPRKCDAAAAWNIRAQSAVAEGGLRDWLQRKCSEWGTYWRAPDAHGVVLNMEQALELLCDALGVEVEITAAPAEAKPADEDGPEAVCAEAYQVVGSLLDDLGIFATERATKVLDNLSQHRRVHKDVLPWPSAKPADAGEVDEAMVAVPASYVVAMRDLVSWLDQWSRDSERVGRIASDAKDAINAAINESEKLDITAALRGKGVG